MPPRVQKITSVSVPLVADIASCWSGIFLAFASRLEARDDFGMVAAAVRERRAFADLDVAVLRLADGRIIRRVRHVHDQRHVRLERIGDLPRAQQADLLLHVGHGADFRVQLAFRIPCSSRSVSATANVPMRLSNARATARSLRSKSNSSASVIGSPMRTNFSASLRLLTPMSMNRSWIFGGLGSPSCLHQVRRDVADDALDRAVARVDERRAAPW